MKRTKKMGQKPKNFGTITKVQHTQWEHMKENKDFKTVNK